MKNIRQLIINPVIVLLLIQALIFSCTCNLVLGTNVKFLQDQRLTEHEIKFTAQKATKLIVQRKYDEFRELLAPEISHEISNEKLIGFLTKFPLF